MSERVHKGSLRVWVCLFLEDTSCLVGWFGWFDFWRDGAVSLAHVNIPPTNNVGFCVFFSWIQSTPHHFLLFLFLFCPLVVTAQSHTILSVTRYVLPDNLVVLKSVN